MIPWDMTVTDIRVYYHLGIGILFHERFRCMSMGFIRLGQYYRLIHQRKSAIELNAVGIPFLQGG
jgi:hypothetical protein